MQERLTGLARERQTLVDRRGQLAAIFEATGRTEAAGIPRSRRRRNTSSSRRCARSRCASRSCFRSATPRMKLLAARIAKLEAEIEAGIEAGPTGGGATPEGQGGAQASLLDIQLVDIDTQIRAIDAQVSETELRLADVTASIASTPRQHGNVVDARARLRQHQAPI
ncbi:hypothetical protein CEW88_24315 (plasmid) [Alloyangia pacifica]|uniref:Uncharacterized protein n=2 Tax=Alloyangia pacifica TaxID=311180 RepID=A0A2U8HQ18_9RHOB|nr:hypothetical protein CEW88_24315 [Alloyangia pacifica]